MYCEVNAKLHVEHNIKTHGDGNINWIIRFFLYHVSKLTIPWHGLQRLTSLLIVFIITH